MVEATKLGSTSVRFAAYIEELREFFSTRAVRCGSPEDLVPFAERVTEPGAFQDEMGSMVRSIVFREDEALGRGELLELVAVAVGGPEVETAAQEMHASVRQVFVFVNGALRQRMGAPELDRPEESTVTAGDILAATAVAKEAMEDRAVASRSPENGFSAGRAADREQRPTAEQLANRTGAAGNAVLFRAVNMAGSADEDEPQASRLSLRRGARPQWMVPVVVAVAALLGLGAYVLEHGTGRHPGTGTVATSSTAGTGVSASSCVGPMAAGASRSGLEERGRWAHRLLDQKLYEAALPELRDIARADPGYPGINLDESDALLNLKRPDDAREAIDMQIGISECLAKLPSPALDSYCSAEFSPASVGGCRSQLSHIRQSAELQAALVHLELGHRVAPEVGPEASMAGLSKESPVATAPKPRSAQPARPRRVEALPPATEGDTDRVPTASRAVVAKQGRKNGADDSLIHGEGTDSAFGAYSKPQ